MADDSTLLGTKLFGRAFSLVLGVVGTNQQVAAQFNDDDSNGLDISGFDADFEVEKTLKPEPNTCAIKVYNLAESSRKALSGAKKLTVSLSAGYQGGMSLLYFGECRAAWTERQGPDFITHIESGDSEKEIAAARLNTTYGAKVPISQALNAVAQALGVGTGNVARVAAQLESKGIGSINGGALTGNAARRMTDLCRSAGLEWSIQDGNIQLLNIGAVLSQLNAIAMSADTGMIESPTVDNLGIVSAKCLIIPGLIPGTLVNFQSLFVNGGYRVERCHWSGQTYGDDWSCSFEAKKY